VKERGAILSVEFPRSLIARAKKVNAIFHTKTTQLLREGLMHKVEELEEKHRREIALQVADEAAKKEREDYRRRLRAAGSTISPLAPLSTQVRTSGVNSGPTQDPMEALYMELARSIRDAGSEEEKHKRIDSAVAAVNRERPLTAPPRDVILQTIEVCMRKLRDEPVTSTYDNLVDTIIDLSKLKTSGATE